MDAKDQIDKKRKLAKYLQYGGIGAVVIWIAVRNLPSLNETDLSSAVTVPLLLIAIGCGVYSRFLKSQIQTLEYRVLDTAITEAQIAAPAASSPVSLPQSSNPIVRALTTQEEVDAKIAETTKSKTSATLIANICLVLGIVAGISAFVLPLQACSQALKGTVATEGVPDGISAFFSTLIACITIGVIFGVVAALVRASARKSDALLHELSLQTLRLKAAQKQAAIVRRTRRR